MPCSERSYLHLFKSKAQTRQCAGRYQGLGEPVHAAAQVADWRVGVYVRIHGKVSDFDNKKRVIAWQIRPVTDFNEARAAAEPCRLYTCRVDCRGSIGQ